MNNHRTLDNHLKAYRIGDVEGQYKIFSDGGSLVMDGRWHVAGQGVIYTSANYSTAMLEKLAHHNGEMPAKQHYVEIKIPSGTSYEVFNEAHTPDWHTQNCMGSRAFGAKWFREKRSCILLVPSVVARMEQNIIINATHNDFAGISAGLETPVWWDDRLFI
ncbi:RES family NAD+ phosphorylase [Sneathiella glossodoripedis]|uniref:RES family NAD+ phosphorylase n=1 Tax=Sneathiella glossodoripedis TaxID=418853 RepID=UPI000470830D|nr:RES domain-containing protein [Sneathiella glossodoripedis]